MNLANTESSLAALPILNSCLKTVEWVKVSFDKFDANQSPLKSSYAVFGLILQFTIDNS